MELYILAGAVPIALLFLYAVMFKPKNKKEWKVERSIIPIESSGVTFEVETDVRWCPETEEIQYRKSEEVGFFESEWKEVGEYSNLYKKLRENFRQKYEQPNRPKRNRTNWTTASKYK